MNTWETIVNLRVVGWPIPRSVLLQATQVIELGAAAVAISPYTSGTL